MRAKTFSEVQKEWSDAARAKVAEARRRKAAQKIQQHVDRLANLGRGMERLNTLNSLEELYLRGEVPADHPAMVRAKEILDPRLNASNKPIVSEALGRQTRANAAASNAKNRAGFGPKKR